LDLFRFSTKKDDAFISDGYSNWKNALSKFEKHDISQCHQEAAVKMAHRSNGTNVAGLLSTAHQQERQLARTALYTIVTSLHFLCKQGLAIRGHTDANGNFNNLLTLRSNDSTELKSWLARSSYKWISPAVQNEIIQDMALSLLRSYKQDIIDAKYFAIVMDESTDASIKEQASFCFRYVSKDLIVNETFVGYYETAATDAGTLFKLTDDVLTRFELSLENCRGQCFDGASNMAGNISGLQKRISDIEPKALYVHCVSHSLSLAFQDAVSAIPQCRDAINQMKDLIHFIRESPKRLTWFTGFQDSNAKALRPLCPTRWTMRISSVQSIMDNYSELLLFLEDMSETERGDAGSKSNGYLKQLLTFSMFFTLKLLLAVFTKSETLAHSLQSPKLSLSQAQSMVDTLSTIWNSARDESAFNEMWATVIEESASIGIDKPVLPRRSRRPPRRLDGGAESHQDESCEEFYRRIYYSVIDAAMSCLKNRFQSPAFNVAHDIETAVVKAISTDTVPSLNAIIGHFGDDLDEKRLRLHLTMLSDVCREDSSTRKSPLTVTCINDVVLILQKKPEWMHLFPELVKLLRLFLTMPVTSCTAERSFSCLRRLKTYLRSTLTQHIAAAFKSCRAIALSS